MSNPSVSYDVRAIRFIKSQYARDPDGKKKLWPSKTALETHCNKMNSQYAICLSHFDYIIFDNLGANLGTLSPLDRIDQDRQIQSVESSSSCDILKEDNYSYPLYMLRTLKDDACNRAVVDFWSLNSSYTSVVRVHYSYQKERAPHLGSEYFHNLMIEWCKKKPCDIRLIRDSTALYFAVMVPTTKDESIESNVQCLLYDSLELGDCIIVLKSDSMVAALTVSRFLNSIPYVLDSYTYIGIEPKIFENTTMHGNSNRDKIRLASASTRFTVRDLKKAIEFFSRYPGRQMGFITGTADARLRWRSRCSEKAFLDNISSVSPYESEIYEAFRDIITRTGIDWYSNGERTESAVQQFSNDYQQLFLTPEGQSTIAWFLTPGGPSEDCPKWLKQDGLLFLSLKKLVGSVRAMGSDAAMDALADLLIPSMRALFFRISQIDDKKWNPKYSREIEELLQSYFQLIQNISQLQSQLVQHPEIYPAPFYIPAAVLQFELQFAKKCSELFNDQSSEILPYTFYPVILPSYQTDASTFAPLDPRSFDPSHTGNYISPLQINVPINKLYKPYETALQVCHEVAHYCGDICRKRELRFTTLCRCCAAMLMVSWENFIETQNFTINWNDLAILRELESIEIRIRELCSGAQPQYYLSDVKRELIKNIHIIGSDSRFIEYFHNILFVSGMSHHSDFQVKLAYQRNKLNDRYPFQTYWNGHINYLTMLCKECYADIAMLILTGCSIESYIQALEASFASLEQSTSEPNKIWTYSKVKLHIDRVAFVLHVMGEASEATKIKSPKPTKWLDQALKQVKVLQTDSPKLETFNELTSWNGPMQNFSTMSQIERIAITDYLQACKLELFVKVTDLHTNSSELANLQDALDAISPNKFDWATVQEFVWQIQYGDKDCPPPSKVRDKEGALPT